jgi:hypothetical protein
MEGHPMDAHSPNPTPNLQTVLPQSVNSISTATPRAAAPQGLAKYEQQLKWIALGLGVLSTIAIVQNWYPWNMFISLPFCMIWIYCGWLRTEPQLKWINVLFAGFYIYGIARYFVVGA